MGKNRLSELLPVPYFHVVFTVPRELIPLAYKNQRSFYSLLFASAQNTLLAVCENPENLGGRVGGMSVLHTWNQKLGYHPHRTLHRSQWGHSTGRGSLDPRFFAIPRTGETLVAGI